MLSPQTSIPDMIIDGKHTRIPELCEHTLFFNKINLITQQTRTHKTDIKLFIEWFIQMHNYQQSYGAQLTCKL